MSYLVKLVRDDVGTMLGGDGTVTYGPLPRDQHAKLLRRKLIEEAAEYLADPSLGELADVLEAIVGLAHVDLAVTLHEVENERQRKRCERGGFDRGTAMWATHPADSQGDAAASDETEPA